MRPVGLIVGLALIVSVFVSMVPQAAAPFQTVMRPLWHAGNAISGFISNVSVSLTSKQSLQNRIDELERRLLSEQQSIAQAELLKNENQRLMELWDQRVYENTVLARILVRPTVSPYDTVVIDAGSGSGITVDDIVIVDNIPIGKVTRALTSTSMVELFSTSGVESDVLVGFDGVPARAVGQGGGTFRLDLPRDIEISEGDIVVLARFPSSVLASVEAVLVEASDPFQTILFKNPINISDLDWVEVLTQESHARVEE